MIDVSAFWRELFSYIIIVPGIVLCYFCMRNQLRLSPGILTPMFFGISFVLSAIGSYLTCRFGVDGDSLFYPVLVLLFLLFHATLRVDISRSLCFFLTTCSIMTCLCNFAAALESALFPEVTMNLANPVKTLFSLGLGLAAAAALAYPMLRFGTKLIDNFSVPSIWYVMAWLMGGFLLIYIGLQPTYYDVLREGSLFIFYCAIHGMLLALQLTLFFFFYQIVMTMMELETERRRVRILEFQEKQFQDQQNYLAETRRVRHDFRHTILALKGMSDAGDQAGIADFLDRYVEDMPVNEVTSFCANTAVNATLNYYAHAAREGNIRTHWQIDLPESCPVAEVDLCAILGNILENAVRACKTVPESDRSIHLTVTTMDEPNLYIAASNAFDGRVRRRGEDYLSTREGGTGMGLSSITLTAQKYGGSARFHHEGRIFCSDVRIPLEGGVRS